MPASELLGALQTGRIDAANLIHLQAFEALKSGEYKPLLPTAEDIVSLFRVEQVSAVNVGYPERLDAHPDDYKEFDRMIKASVDYGNAHTAEVGKAIADQFHISPEFFGWWLKTYSIFPGVVGSGDLKSMEVVWENAKALGLMQNYPKAESVIWKMRSANSRAPGRRTASGPGRRERRAPASQLISSRSPSSSSGPATA